MLQQRPGNTIVMTCCSRSREIWNEIGMSGARVNLLLPFGTIAVMSMVVRKYQKVAGPVAPAVEDRPLAPLAHSDCQEPGSDFLIVP